MTKKAAYETSGIKTVYWLQDMEKIMFELMTQCDTVYINTNEHYRANVETETREARYVKWLRAKYQLTKQKKVILFYKDYVQ